MCQFLYFIPLLNGNIPPLIVTFINNYLSVIDISFPFELIPIDFINPIYLLSDFITPPFNTKFLDAGYQSVSIIFNLANQIWTWLTLLFSYFILRFLVRALPGKRY